MRTIAAAAFAVLIFGCASTTTKPGSGAHLSAAQEQVAAAQQEKEAAEHRSHYDPSAKQAKEVCTPGGAGHGEFGECWTNAVNPTATQIDQAREHERVAAQRRASSKTLMAAEVRACAGLADYDRDISPFSHKDDILSVSLLQKGAIVVFKPVPTLTAEHLQKIIDCHIARNDALGHNVPEMSYCPLVPRDVSAKVTPTGEGFSVTILSTDSDAAREVRLRAQALTSR